MLIACSNKQQVGFDIGGQHKKRLLKTTDAQAFTLTDGIKMSSLMMTYHLPVCCLVGIGTSLLPQSFF